VSLVFLEGWKGEMSHAVLKGFLCKNDTGKEYSVIEYLQPKLQTNVRDATGSERFFSTKGLEVVQIDANTFKIVKTSEVIKSEIPI
jgi:hypothetical protein